MTHWLARDQIAVFPKDPVPKIMGIVNVTPDSFSDGGKSLRVDDAVAHARRLAKEGATILDLGGESTRPGSRPISAEEELDRLVPVLKQLAGGDFTLSIDTTKAAVAREAIRLGASVINDISALSADPEMVEVVARSKAGVVLMHMQGTPETMQVDPRYDDVVEEVAQYLEERVDWCLQRGVSLSRIAIDPGIGFGKTIEHNLLLLRNLNRFRRLGCAVVIGTSRKGFLGTLTGRTVSDRMVASVVSSLAACEAGASIVRVHDVGPMRDAIQVWDAVRGWRVER